MKKFIFLAACLASAAVCSAANVKPGEILLTTIRESCAPWDGPAIEIKIKKIGVTAHLYHQDIDAIKEGRPVEIKSDPGNMESGATQTEKSSPIGWKNIRAKIWVNRKTRRGQITIERRSYPLRIQWRKTRPVLCG